MQISWGTLSPQTWWQAWGPPVFQGPCPAPTEMLPSGRVPITKIQRLLPPIGDSPPSRELGSCGKNWRKQTSEAAQNQDRSICSRSAKTKEELCSESPELTWPGNVCDLWPQLAKDKLQFSCRGLARSFKSFAAKKKKKRLCCLSRSAKTTCPRDIRDKRLLALGATFTTRDTTGGLGVGQ